MLSERVCVAYYLGVIPYERALELQQLLVQARTKGKIPDIVLLLQHPSVFTVGRFRGEEDIIVPPERLSREGVPIFPTNRGGGITYHGPGQLVGYPILNLKENCLFRPTHTGVREYIWRLEEVIIRVLHTLNIQGHRVVEYPGVWIGEEKICSIGIHVSHYITMHGFALNVNPDLRYFECINPCGISVDTTKNRKVMTSISELVGYPVEVKDIIESLLHSFSEVFRLKCESVRSVTKGEIVDACPC